MQITRQLTPFLYATGLLILSGCAQNAIHHVVVEGYPSMAERYADLKPLGQNDARVILYWPEKTFFENHAARVVLDGDDGSIQPVIGYRTAELIDLPAGSYSIGISNSEKTILLEAQPKETYCYNVGELKNWSSESNSNQSSYEDDYRSSEKDDQVQIIEKPKLVPLETCIADFQKDDIRCAHKECLVKTVVPTTSVSFQQYAPGMEHDKLETEARNFDIDKDLSRIYITRKMYTLGMVRVGVDGKPETKVESSSFVVYEVEPGEHTVIAAIGGPHNIAQAYRLSTEPGECYFFHSDKFTFLSASEGKKLVMDYDLLERGFYKQ